jgi:hypothetical protein
MMLDEKKNLLALYRLQQAKESLEEARYLLEGGKICCFRKNISARKRWTAGRAFLGIDPLV